MEVSGLKECMVILILYVDTRAEKRMRVWEAQSIQYRIADRLEECSACLVIETIDIYDFVFASYADHISFRDIALVKKAMF